MRSAFAKLLSEAIEIAAAGENIVVLGIRPTRPKPATDTSRPGGCNQGDALHVRRFTEKPNAERAAEFVAAGNFFWNSGMFLWSAHTLANALTRASAEDGRAAGKNRRRRYGTSKFAATFQAALSEMRKHQHRLCRA